jgi:tetratricopeptide (TPR) repeat protein
MLQPETTGETASGASGDPEHAETTARPATLGDRMRRTLLLALVGWNVLASQVASGQQPVRNPLVGRRVVQRFNAFNLHIENRIVDPRRAIHFYRVEQVEGPWLWVKAEGNGLSGWALADHIVPVDEGIDFFTEQIRNSPTDVFPYVMRAMLWQDKKQIDRALQDYDEVLRLDPGRGWIYNNRGHLHFERKDHERALSDFNHALQFEPDNANFLNNRGTLRRAMKVHDLAIDDFSQAIRSRPDYASGYYNRGLTWADKKEFDKAIADFNEVVRLDPDDALAYYHRGLAWSAKQQYDSAIADFDRANQRNEKLSFVYLDRGQARAARKEYDKAIADYAEVIRLSPRNANAFYHRGLARVEIKEYDKALADYDQAIKLDPRFDEAYLSRAWLLASCPNPRLRDPKKAVESATKACELTNWNEAHDLGGLAAVYAETGNVAAALKWQSKAIELMTGEDKVKMNTSLELGHP